MDEAVDTLLFKRRSLCLVLVLCWHLKINGLTGYGIEIVGREPIEMTCNEKNEFYMYTKYKKMGHMIHVRQREEIEKLKEGLENK